MKIPLSLKETLQQKSITTVTHLKRIYKISIQDHRGKFVYQHIKKDEDVPRWMNNKRNYD
jgi:hypothetical protein